MGSQPAQPASQPDDVRVSLRLRLSPSSMHACHVSSPELLHASRLPRSFSSPSACHACFCLCARSLCLLLACSPSSRLSIASPTDSTPISLSLALLFIRPHAAARVYPCHLASSLARLLASHCNTSLSRPPTFTRHLPPPCHWRSTRQHLDSPLRLCRRPSSPPSSVRPPRATIVTRPSVLRSG